MPHKSFIGGTFIRTIVARVGPRVIAKLSESPGTDQVIGEFRKILELPGGEAIEQGVREWADRIPSQWRAAVNPLLEDFFRPRGGVTSEEDMRPQRGRPPQRDGSQGRQEQNPLVLGRQKITALSDTLRFPMKTALLRVQPSSVRNLIIIKLASYTPAALQNFAEDVLLGSVGGRIVDLLDLIGLKDDPEVHKVKKTGVDDDLIDAASKMLEELARVDTQACERIIDVTCDTAFDSDEDEARYYRVLARMYGDGNSERVKRSVSMLRKVSRRSIKKRRHFFGVRIDLGKQAAGWASGILFDRAETSPVTDRQLKAARARCDQAESAFDAWYAARQVAAAPLPATTTP
ncbi:MAG: hypothetical protein A2898_05780 [Candidatus Kerfeldbacteria bacterium RIFCSPLOWO2_01_FULL_48_11]|uniref:Uncharacterized protein n=1 Tax=Candidatus Kerfeldbacteria bacterium RIFCSPLOWO2_01_FULL_48_11 TaxID=1798543 RepID=A0A1G2B380_9BACT|nr:MAG: hypothetical protein UY34_C0007G0005 [Parcubacteria group bacterium GW2011_GWA2_48_9]OGY83661.1 MAG: hypothetical protein A2898_05780 [Candidatus Kerfeldbacteria bacterium RIFCSPLOWO2_01_FULL_48_11]HCM67958.1 hypothetical protein [Candidatus Kerfeldbacteria bacterium]